LRGQNGVDELAPGKRSGADEVEGAAEGGGLGGGEGEATGYFADADGLDERFATVDEGDGMEEEEVERPGEDAAQGIKEAIAFVVAVDEGGAEDGPVQATLADEFLGLPFGEVVAGAGTGAGADGTHLHPAGDASLPGGGEEVAGGFDVGLFVGDVGGFGDDADEVDDGGDAGHNSRERFGAQGVPDGELDARMVGDVAGAVGAADEKADSAAKGKEFPDDFVSYKSGASSNKNHRTPFPFILRRMEVGRKLGSGHAESSCGRQ